MKGKLRLALLAAAVFMSVFFAFAAGAKPRTETEPVKTVLENTAREYPETEENKYVLKEHDSRISVYCGEERIKDTDISVPQLRAYDREILAHGIMVNSYGEVLSLLEDFES